MGYRVRIMIIAASPLPFVVDAIYEYGSIRQIELRYEKLPPLFCSYYCQVGHRQTNCPFWTNDLEVQQRSSAGEDDPDDKRNHNLGTIFLILTIGLEASHSNNQVNGVTSVASLHDVDLMLPWGDARITTTINNIEDQLGVVQGSKPLLNNTKQDFQAVTIQQQANTTAVEPYIPQHVQPPFL